MKFKCGPTKDEMREAARDWWCVWHKWFAWRPVKIASNDCRWLETVERKADFVFGGFFVHFTPADFKYREVTK